MNETITLSPRQKAILNLFAASDHLSRESISQTLEPLFPISKATLARDLATLVDAKLIAPLGNGPQTTYHSTHPHPLLKPVDLDQYLAVEPDQRRRAQAVLNPQVFNHLADLFSHQELETLAKLHKSLTQTMNTYDPTTKERELERFVIELAWKSSKIEGNTYTLLQTESLIKEAREAAGHSHDEAVMILNHKAAFQAIQNHSTDFLNLNRSLVQQLHQTLIENLSITPGIRQHGVGITGTSYRPPDNQWQLEEYLDQLIDTVNQIPHPLHKAFLILAMIAYLQPFADGNKRTARMLSNAILIAHDYFPLSYRSIKEEEYKGALILFYETNNLYHLKRLFLEQYRFALTHYFV